MDSGICILLMILLILGFALLLAWLSAKGGDTADAVHLCLTLPPDDGHGPQQLCVEACRGSIEIHFLPAPPPKPCSAKPAPQKGPKAMPQKGGSRYDADARLNSPAPADGADF